MKTPESINEWCELAPWSNLKHPKKWMRKKRLINKFNHNHSRYLSLKIIYRYRTRGELIIQRMHNKVMEEIMREEDKIFESIIPRSY